MKKTMTTSSIMATKGKKPLVMLTAYDALFARLLAPSVDILLVGDSLNMSFAGKDDTLSATLDQMIYHTKAVSQGAPQSFVICDMPFGTYSTKESALANAIRVYQESGADSVKIEGGEEKAEIIRHLTMSGIAVCGHIGLLPQSVRCEGGYKVKGKCGKETLKLIEDARAVEEAGAFCMVIEGVKAEVAAEVAQSVNIPVVGIGAGAGVDGQVLVFSDMLGLYEEFTPKFVKKYLDGASLVKEAVSSYAKEVQEGTFPQEQHTY